jgi:RimJ/RimL family protein N-acetyltransferase
MLLVRYDTGSVVTVEENMPPIFRQGPLVSLRPLEVGDAVCCQRWVNDEEATRYLLVGRRPVTLQEEEDFLRGLSGNAAQVACGIELNSSGTLVGVCGLHDIDVVDRCATLGIFFGAEEHRGRGYGREALQLLLDYGFGTLNLHRVELQVLGGNERARRCYQALGFREEGVARAKRFVHGEYLDELHLGLLATEWAAQRRGGAAAAR